MFRIKHHLPLLIPYKTRDHRAVPFPTRISHVHSYYFKHYAKWRGTAHPVLSSKPYQRTQSKYPIIRQGIARISADIFCDGWYPAFYQWTLGSPNWASMPSLAELAGMKSSEHKTNLRIRTNPTFPISAFSVLTACHSILVPAAVVQEYLSMRSSCLSNISHPLIVLNHLRLLSFPFKLNRPPSSLHLFIVPISPRCWRYPTASLLMRLPTNARSNQNGGRIHHFLIMVHPSMNDKGYYHSYVDHFIISSTMNPILIPIFPPTTRSFPPIYFMTPDIIVIASVVIFNNKKFSSAGKSHR